MADSPARNVLSRGEQKMLSAALLFSQAEILAGAGEKPLILLDDLASEFDESHFARVIELALASGCQVWLTGVKKRSFDRARKVFHVERGSVQEVV
jgi:DNA replication and repair protein RecF